MTASVDPTVAHGDRKSARLTFDGTENVGTTGLSQQAFVPAGRYKFQAYIKSDGITTDKGVLFGISGNGLNVTTDDVVGTTDWHLVEKSFEVVKADFPFVIFQPIVTSFLVPRALKEDLERIKARLESTAGG